MVRQVVRKVARLAGLAAGTVLLVAFSAVPVLAGSLAISPSSTELEMLPGTTARVVLSVENGLDSGYTFRFSPAQASHPREGYGTFPDLSWLSVDPQDKELAPGERGWVTIRLSVPDDEGLTGQGWVAAIEMVCEEQPLLNSEFLLLVSVGKASRPRPDWEIGGGIVVTCLVGAVLWNRWKEMQRAEWTTGLRSKHWLE